MSDKILAILGGEPIVTIQEPEQWKRPVEQEKQAVCQLIEQGTLSGAGSGLPKAFEDAFREFIGSDYCLTVNHGTEALTSAYYAVGVGPGDEVITPAVGYICSYAGALHLGARPVFCEIDPNTLLIDPEDAERRITERTRAINVVHYSGRVCDLDAFWDIGKRYGIAIVEDAAHAHGAEWDGKKVGSVGDIACFSLQGTLPGGKPIACGEGGIVTTGNRDFYERQLAFCHLHRSGILGELTKPEYQGLDSEVLGRKWRAHPLALAIASVGLGSLAYRNQRRLENRAQLFDGLRELPGLEPVHTYPKSKPAGFYMGWKVLYHPEALGGLPIERFVEAVRAEGAPISKGSIGGLEYLRTIFTDGFDLWGEGRGPLGDAFCGLPPFRGYRRGDFPISERVIDRVLTIPAYIEPKEGFLNQVIEACRKVTRNHRALI